MCWAITSTGAQTMHLWYSFPSCVFHSCVMMCLSCLFLSHVSFASSAFAVSTAPRLLRRRWRRKERGGTRTPSWVWPTRWRCRCCPHPPPCPAPPRLTWVNSFLFFPILFRTTYVFDLRQGSPTFSNLGATLSALNQFAALSWNNKRSQLALRYIWLLMRLIYVKTMIMLNLNS